MAKKYIVFSLEDEESKKIGEIIGNKTSKKILNFLAENEASESRISEELKIPINTVEYNLNKLTSTGLVEKSKRFFWSNRGKKMPTYRAANKHIIISPKSTKGLKDIFLATLIAFIGAFFIKLYTSTKEITSYSRDAVLSVAEESMAIQGESALEIAKQTSTRLINYSPSTPELWPWFLAGALITLLVILILNWRSS